jgi:hypothetical protein
MSSTPFDEGYVEPSAALKHKGAGIIYHPELDQGSEEWLAARCGLMTASEMKFILTPTLKAASNDKERAHLWELAGQRISGYVEPHYIGDDMLRGHEDEVEAIRLYQINYAKVRHIGFMTNDRWGFTLGYSPDGLVDDDGLVEAKSRRQKFQIQHIVENVPKQGIFPEFMMQAQVGLLVSERAWIDHISFSGGLPMSTVRIYPDPVLRDAIINVAGAFEKRIAAAIARYHEVLASDAHLIQTERRIEQEMY